MQYLISSFLLFLLTPPASAQVDSSPEALNTTDYNLILQAPGGPVLYYNGTGNVPPYNETSPEPIPITPLNSTSALEDAFYTELFAIANGTVYSDNCTQCVAGAQVMHFAAISLPVESFTNLVIRICENVAAVKSNIYAATCSAEYSSVPVDPTLFSSGAAGLGAYYAQVFSKMSAATGDFNTYCHYQWSLCPAPTTIGINEDLYFSPKPDSANTVPVPSNETLNVLHLSDWHVELRYDIGSEGNCSQSLCCRPYSTNTEIDTNSANASVPASRFGNMHCDSPPDLVLSSLSTMSQFFNMSSIAFTIYTGDLVSHDHDDQLSRAYVSYSEEMAFRTMKAWFTNTPIYATLGNHDSLPEDVNAQNALNPINGSGSNAMSWNYELLTSLWANESWINASEAGYAATHYAAYAHTTAQGLRIISLNTEFWYRNNPYNYWNVTNPDVSGMLTWLAQELTDCEARGQRAWIIGHVLSGYNGKDALPNPTALFYSIVRRFSPTTIAGIFFGHTHEDQIQIFYDYLPNSTYTVNGVTLRNTSMVDHSKPLQVAYIGPSITPLTGLNSGYPLYQIDSLTFSVMGVQTYYANISNANSWTSPVWQFEYSTRDMYQTAAGGGQAWPSDAALNATFWDSVATAMLTNSTLLQMYNLYETKSSATTENCTTDACQQQKVCYLRSGSVELSRSCGSKNGPP